MAKELGVSHSYLSQVKHGKRPASKKVVSKMVSKGCGYYPQNDIISSALGDSLVVGQWTLDKIPTHELVSKFLKSRRQGLSENTLKFYKYYLSHAPIGIHVTPRDIDDFLKSLQCSNGGKHAYFRALRVFYRWLFSPKSGFKFNMQDNPILLIEAPKVEKQILPSLTLEQVDFLIVQADTLKEKAIISLFADSGMRLNELTSVKSCNVDWSNYTITIWGKGNKQRKAPFTDRSAKLLKQIIAENGTGENIWHMKAWGIVSMLKRLAHKTGLTCNPHTFRRTFASNLHRAGIDVEHIMRLGGWESLDMVLRYTRSIKFEDSLKIYQSIQNKCG